jgi:hypothetical protein
MADAPTTLVAGFAVAAAVAAFPGETHAAHEHWPASAAAVPASGASPFASGPRAATDESSLPSDPLSEIHPCSRHPTALSWTREFSSFPLFDHRTGSVPTSRHAFLLRSALARQVLPGSDLAPVAVNCFVRG